MNQTTRMAKLKAELRSDSASVVTSTPRLTCTGETTETAWSQPLEIKAGSVASDEWIA